MRLMRREASSELRQRSYGSCYVGVGMAGSLLAALLGAIYQQQAVWIAGLAVFSLFCAQAGAGYYFSRERVAVDVQIEVPKTGRDRALTSAML
jgi:hypothetical protein